MEPLLLRVNAYVRRWAGKKYRKLRTFKRFMWWWGGLFDDSPSCLPDGNWVRTDRLSDG